MLVGYARCSTDQQDLTAQPDALTALGVKPNRIYVDHGLTSTNRAPWFARSAGRVPVRRKQPKLKPAQEATWSNSGEPANTPAPSWPSRSPSPAPPSTALCNAPESRKRLGLGARERARLRR